HKWPPGLEEAGAAIEQGLCQGDGITGHFEEWAERVFGKAPRLGKIPQRIPADPKDTVSTRSRTIGNFIQPEAFQMPHRGAPATPRLHRHASRVPGPNRGSGEYVWLQRLLAGGRRLAVTQGLHHANLEGAISASARQDHCSVFTHRRLAIAAAAACAVE